MNHKKSLLNEYFLLSYLLMLINTAVFLAHIEYDGLISILFAASVYITYTTIYIAPPLLIIAILERVLNLSAIQNTLNKIHLNTKIILYPLAVIILATLQVLIFADGFIFKLYGFHINGFVWNLVCTKGGIESMGGDAATVTTFTAVIVAFFFLQTMLMVLIIKSTFLKKLCQKILTKKRVALASGLIVLLATTQAFIYGIARFQDYSPVLTSADAFPQYLPITFTHLAKKLGFQSKNTNQFRLKTKNFNINYPTNPITQKPNHKNYNIVWLVAESLRADMLTSEIMPATWNFSQNALRFEQHYSGGNGTRMGLFSMFYGLYGNYWFNVLDEKKGPVLIDLLIKNNYQMAMFSSSAKFSYPEFDKTIFAQIPQANLHDLDELTPGPGWQADRQNVTKLLDFIQNHDTNKPFMTFMFFESPHARYYFPKENIIRENYLKDFNYATMNLKQDIQLIKNRYINSCNHLDSQFQRILECLKQNDLLKNTILIITGDHGEEFLEKGRWGHNSTFSEEQTRTPLVIHIPDQPHRVVTQMTSHLDIPPTIMNQLAVTNPTDDYCLGYDLLGPVQRNFTILADWNRIAYIDQKNKAVFPFRSITRQTVTTKNDTPITNKTNFFQSNQQTLLLVMKQLAQFSK